MVWRSVIRSVLFGTALALAFILSAGTAQWIGAWIYVAAVTSGGIAMTLWLAQHDPELLRERTGRNKLQGADRILLPALFAAAFVWLFLMALDVRAHGTHQMPVWLNAVGGLAMLAGFAACTRVFRANRFATAHIEVQTARGHTVIDSGPYALVRHPLYGIAIVTYLMVPFTLGSWAGFLGAPLLVWLVDFRAAAEERKLEAELAGYHDYMARVRYRFVPHVW